MRVVGEDALWTSTNVDSDTENEKGDARVALVVVLYVLAGSLINARQPLNNSIINDYTL